MTLALPPFWWIGAGEGDGDGDMEDIDTEAESDVRDDADGREMDEVMSGEGPTLSDCTPTAETDADGDTAADRCVWLR